MTSYPVLVGSTKHIISVLKSKHSPVCPWQDYQPYLHSLYACLLEIQSCKKFGHLHFCKRQIRFRKMSLIICIRQRTRKNCFCKKLREDHNLPPHKTNFQNKTVDLPIIFNQNIGSLWLFKVEVEKEYEWTLEVFCKLEY